MLKEKTAKVLSCLVVVVVVILMGVVSGAVVASEDETASKTNSNLKAGIMSAEVSANSVTISNEYLTMYIYSDGNFKGTTAAYIGFVHTTGDSEQASQSVLYSALPGEDIMSVNDFLHSEKQLLLLAPPAEKIKSIISAHQYAKQLLNVFAVHRLLQYPGFELFR